MTDYSLKGYFFELKIILGDVSIGDGTYSMIRYQIRWINVKYSDKECGVTIDSVAYKQPKNS